MSEGHQKPQPTALLRLGSSGDFACPKDIHKPEKRYLWAPAATSIHKVCPKDINSPSLTPSLAKPA